MENRDFFQKLDEFFEKNQIEEAGVFLEQSLKEARDSKDISLEISVLNEMMGYYRSTDQEEKGIQSVKDGLVLIQSNGLETHPAVANMWINMGTTLCHFERVQEAETCYKNAELFLMTSPGGAITMASLYNNTAAVFVKKGNYEEAYQRYCMALETLKKLQEQPEYWEDLMFNRIVTWLNIIVMRKVQMASSKETDLKKEEALFKILNYILSIILEKNKRNDRFHCFSEGKMIFYQ